jgi:hypothetical protein
MHGDRVCARYLSRASGGNAVRSAAYNARDRLARRGAPRHLLAMFMVSE